jgi:DNA-binding protein H-NS
MSSSPKISPLPAPTISPEGMTDQQLADLRQQVEAEQKKRETRQKREAKKQIVELAAQHGIDLATLAAQPSDSAKYRDPDNQFNTWSGRGRKPEWVRKALEKGIKLDELKT